MKAPNVIEREYLAPCGINCMLCYRHLDKKRKPCPGCFSKEAVATEYCRKCKMRSCTAEKGIRYCFECAEFPCARMKAFARRYRTGYGVTLIEDDRLAAECGTELLLRQHLAKYTCTECGGLINMHDGVCSECKKEFPLGKRSVQP